MVWRSGTVAKGTGRAASWRNDSWPWSVAIACPSQEVNARIDRFIVDFLWRTERLVVEVDGWESHGTRWAFEADRARDARLKLLGFDVLRFTWRQIADDRGEVASLIREVLRRAA